MLYMTKNWSACKHRSTPPTPEMVEHDRWIRSLQRPNQIAFVQIMVRHDGNPSGIEFRHHSDAERWSFVLPDASTAGYRAQFFDTHGFSGHTHFETVEQAVDEMVQRGFRIEDVGALDRVSQNPPWAQGMAWLERLTMLNQMARST